MPYTYKINTEHNIVIFKARGAFTAEILFNCLKEVISSAGFQPGFNHLVDLREVTSFPATTADMHKRVELDLDIEKQLGKCKIALVTSNELVFGMSRMYEMLMDNAIPEVRSFRNINEAILWMGIEKELLE